MTPLLGMIVMLSLFPRQARAQSATVSTTSTQLENYAYLNGGGVEIGSTTGLSYPEPLNVIADTEASPLLIRINGNVVYDGVPDRLASMKEDETLYQHKLNPRLANSEINLDNKNSVAVRIGGTLPTYTKVNYESIDSTNYVVRPTSYSVFPSIFPSVFRRPTAQ